VGKKLMLLKKKIEGKKSENLKAEKKINLAQNAGSRSLIYYIIGLL